MRSFVGVMITAVEKSSANRSGSVEQGPDALGVLGQIRGMLVRSRRSWATLAMPSILTTFLPMSVTSSPRLTLGLPAMLRSFCFPGWL